MAWWGELYEHYALYIASYIVQLIGCGYIAVLYLRNVMGLSCTDSYLTYHSQCSV